MTQLLQRFYKGMSEPEICSVLLALKNTCIKKFKLFIYGLVWFFFGKRTLAH